MWSQQQVTLLLTLLAHAQPYRCATLNRYCKPTSSSPDWPSADVWRALNQTVNGHLVAPVPPGAPCHSEFGPVDNQTCSELAKIWMLTAFHSNNSVSVDYNDETCLPNPDAPCSAKGYPVYVIEATTPNDVQEGVRFAKRTGVRLVIKGTGHDYPGRSVAPESLSIWTHKLQGIELNMDDPRAIKYGGSGSIKMQAGMRFGEINAYLAKHNLSMVTGADAGVGVGGWYGWGGHSPVSAWYGMGADQVLEMEVVTADGTFLTINEHCHPDLFWAMRGGGASTFGVLISVTAKVYPQLPAAVYLYQYNTTVGSETYWDMNAYFHSQLPALSNAGLMGYYFNFQFPIGYNSSDGPLQASIGGVWYAPHKTVEQVEAILSPMVNHLKSQPWADKIITRGFGIPSNYTSFISQNIDESVGAGASGRLGSRLLDAKSLTGDQAKLKALLKKSTPFPWPQLGHVVSNPGAGNAVIPGGGNAVLPAWRNAVTHLVLPRSWILLNTTNKQEVTTKLREIEIPALKELAPDTGAYVNECDPSEPDWKKQYYGSNYEKLLSIKKKWDATGVFWCRPCVGYDLWTIDGGDGIGENGGRLCRVTQ